MTLHASVNISFSSLIRDNCQVWLDVDSDGIKILTQLDEKTGQWTGQVLCSHYFARPARKNRSKRVDDNTIVLNETGKDLYEVLRKLHRQSAREMSHYIKDQGYTFRAPATPLTPPSTIASPEDETTPGVDDVERKEDYQEEVEDHEKDEEDLDDVRSIATTEVSETETETETEDEGRDHERSPSAKRTDSSTRNSTHNTLRGPVLPHITPLHAQGQQHHVTQAAHQHQPLYGVQNGVCSLHGHGYGFPSGGSGINAPHSLHHHAWPQMVGPPSRLSYDPAVAAHVTQPPTQISHSAFSVPHFGMNQQQQHQQQHQQPTYSPHPMPPPFGMSNRVPPTAAAGPARFNNQPTKLPTEQELFPTGPLPPLTSTAAATSMPAGGPGGTRTTVAVINIDWLDHLKFTIVDSVPLWRHCIIDTALQATNARSPNPPEPRLVGVLKRVRVGSVCLDIKGLVDNLNPVVRGALMSGNGSSNGSTQTSPQQQLDGSIVPTFDVQIRSGPPLSSQ